MSARSFPVVGAARPYVSRDWHVTGNDFAEFETATMQGLMRVRGDTLDVLAINAKRPGHGDGSRFISAAMASYTRIRFLHLMNADFERMLVRSGFVKGVVYEDGEIIDTLEWARA